MAILQRNPRGGIPAKRNFGCQLRDAAAMIFVEMCD
jgi:phage baseplate assembly protein W